MIEHDHATFSPQTRRQRILERLDSDGECSIDQLVKEFGVSGMTIRRDLSDLEAAGSIIRTHGGAAPSGQVVFDFQFLQRIRLRAHEKEEIARVAVSLVQPGQHVFLDSSSTTLAIARQLKTLSSVTVVTTSLPVAATLFGLDHVEVILLGGQLRKNAPDLSGPITERAIEVLRGHVAFIACDAVDERGAVSTNSVQLVPLLGLLERSVDRRYIVADHTKLNSTALMQFADLRQWDGLITDSSASPKALEVLRQAGVKVFTPSETRA